MARLFNIALEEGEELSAGVVAPQDEIDAIENAESAAVTEAEIEQGSDEVTEALEEANELQEQVNVNEQILENTSPEDGTGGEAIPDAAADAVDDGLSGEVVTETQVVEAQEALKYAIATFGDKVGYVNTVRLSLESSKTLSRRERLRIANEGAKDFILKLIETAKRVIKQIINKVVVWIKQIGLKFGNYGKQIEKAKKSLGDAKFDNNDAVNTKLKDSFSSLSGAEYNYAKLNKDLDLSILTKTATSTKAMQLILNAASSGRTDFAKLESYTVDVAKYGYKAPAAAEGAGPNRVCGITGDSALVIGDNGYSKQKLESNGLADNKHITADDATKLAGNLVANYAIVVKAVTNSSANLKSVQKVQSDTLAMLDKQKATEGDNKQVVNKNIEVAKSIAIIATMFKINEYIGCIKAYSRLLTVLAAAKNASGSETKKEETKQA